MLLAALVLVAPGCGPAAQPPSPIPAATATPQLPPGSVEHRLDIKGFILQSLTIKVGESILWTNREAHNVIHAVEHITVERGVGPEFSSPNLQPGESFRHTFTKPGEYHYVCRIHPVKERAVITVVEDLD